MVCWKITLYISFNFTFSLCKRKAMRFQYIVDLNEELRNNNLKSQLISKPVLTPIVVSWNYHYM